MASVHIGRTSELRKHCANLPLRSSRRQLVDWRVDRAFDEADGAQEVGFVLVAFALRDLLPVGALEVPGPGAGHGLPVFEFHVGIDVV